MEIRHNSCVITYNAGAEMARLRELAEAEPTHAIRLRAITQNMCDPNGPFPAG